MASPTPDWPRHGTSPSPRACANGAPAALSTTSWSPRGELRVNDWVDQGRWLGALGRASGWWLGDWLRYGNARYGCKYAAAAKATGYDAQTLMNMAYVAGRFEVFRRREGLSFGHHAELAGLATEDQDLWLDRAVAGRLSVRALRRELQEARRRVASRLARGESRATAGLAPRAPIASGHVVGVGVRRTTVPPEVDPVRGAPNSGETRQPSCASERILVCPHCGGRLSASVAGQTSGRARLPQVRDRSGQ